MAIGAQNAFVLSQGVRRCHYLIVPLICSLCDATLIVAGIAGIGTAVAASPFLTRMAAWGGAVFLLWYGLGAFRSALRSGSLESDTGGRRDGATHPRLAERSRRAGLPSRAGFAGRDPTRVRLLRHAGIGDSRAGAPVTDPPDSHANPDGCVGLSADHRAVSGAGDVTRVTVPPSSTCWMNGTHRCYSIVRMPRGGGPITCCPRRRTC